MKNKIIKIFLIALMLGNASFAFAQEELSAGEPDATAVTAEESTPADEVAAPVEETEKKPKIKRKPEEAVTEEAPATDEVAGATEEKAEEETKTEESVEEKTETTPASTEKSSGDAKAENSMKIYFMIGGGIAAVLIIGAVVFFVLKKKKSGISNEKMPEEELAKEINEISPKEIVQEKPDEKKAFEINLSNPEKSVPIQETPQQITITPPTPPSSEAQIKADDASTTPPAQV